MAIWNLLNKGLNSAELPGVEYAEPAGDPGIFGPGSAVWYVHSHISIFMAGAPVLLTQGLERNMAASGSTSRAFADPVSRLGRSGSFALGMTFGSTATAERLPRVVRAMHDRVNGVAPDGQPYSANDPDSMRFAAAIFPLGLLAAHRRYHPRPLRGAAVDRFVAEWAVITESLGAPDVPTTYRETLGYVESVIPSLRPTLYSDVGPVKTDRALTFWGLVELWLRASPLPKRVTELVLRGMIDLLPSWARELYEIPPLSRTQTRTTRAALFSMLNSIQAVAGEADYVVQARRRVAQAPMPAHGTRLAHA
jgi:uncharacterized protein (DUF2236 family)